MNESQTMVLNMGPQHPSTHGVLRLVLELDGERVVNAAPEIGYLHTGIEKQAESHTWTQAITLTDRTDYVTPLTNNLGYVLAVEKLLGLQVPERAQVIRVMMAELSRLSSHLVWLGTGALDLGAMSVFFYCFQEREKILDLFEMTAGTRMNPSYLRVGGVWKDLPEGFLPFLSEFVKEFPKWLDECLTLLDRNPIWRQRLEGVGRITTAQCLDYGVTGPILRATGLAYDLRKAAPYSGYEHYAFDVPTAEAGDAYARYLVRVEEMRQSVRILAQALERLPEGPTMVADPKVALPPREELSQSMEALIHHFKLVSEGFKVPPGQVYVGIEGPKGEVGYYLVADGGPRPYRMRIRPASFYNLQALPLMAKGALMADLVAIIGSIDIIMGEVDR